MAAAIIAPPYGNAHRGVRWGHGLGSLYGQDGFSPFRTAASKARHFALKTRFNFCRRVSGKGSSGNPTSPSMALVQPNHSPEMR